MFVANKQEPLLNGPPKITWLKAVDAVFGRCLDYLVKVSQLVRVGLELHAVM